MQGQQFDLTILDLNIARLDTLEIQQHIRAARSQLPTLVLSHRNRPEDRVQALDLSADELVMKPFSFSELSGHSASGYGHYHRTSPNDTDQTVPKPGELTW